MQSAWSHNVTDLKLTPISFCRTVTFSLPNSQTTSPRWATRKRLERPLSLKKPQCSTLPGFQQLNSRWSRNLHQTLLKFGFRSGVFHVEARVRDSSMQYGVSDGVLDLQTAAGSSVTKTPKCFLIEVNPRLPGLMCCTAAHCTYGISYAALHQLIAIGDAERTAAFSQPFCAGSQYWITVLDHSTGATLYSSYPTKVEYSLRMILGMS